MKLSQLKYFAAVAETGSFSLAAARCHVTQPTLSNGIAQLEESLGGRLFERTTRTVSLSSYGAHMRPKISQLLEDERELIVASEAFRNPARKILRMGMSPSADYQRVNNIVGPFFAENPDYEVFCKECFLEDGENRLAPGQLDVMIRPVRGSADAGRSMAPLYAELLLYVPKDCVGTTEPIDFADLAEDTFIMGPTGCGLLEIIQDMFLAHEVPLTLYPGQALSYVSMQEWADIGMGATILPASKLAGPSANCARPIVLKDGKAAKISFAAEYISQPSQQTHIQAFHEFIRGAAGSVPI